MNVCFFFSSNIIRLERSDCETVDNRNATEKMNGWIKRTYLFFFEEKKTILYFAMLVTMPISIKLFMLQPVIYFIGRFHVRAVVDSITTIRFKIQEEKNFKFFLCV